ncbi:hypothetical protein [Nodularia sp. UHCC 0506]|uniref:hypothetical protein n=1 Tax=Nodularia sp. UHCC 0506 TaxID=3110243 RepID=UPI002B1EC50F|nr:hypothetical protein [Nodularia sp. UHCC 0506]MEA5516753.1 hypothetical protein [Nodularia sp. UHCC 0506]
MSSSISQFYTRVVKINKDFSPYKQEDMKLKRNFKLYENNDEIFQYFCQQNDFQKLVIFWINIALNDQLEKKGWETENRVEMAWQHLRCFCEESCYWAANKLANKQKDSGLKHRLMEDCLDYAKDFIYDPIVFRKTIIQYNINNSFLQTYIQSILTNVIKNKQDNKVSKFSPMRMLYKESNSTLTAALARSGFSRSDISKMIFARKHWKSVYSIYFKDPSHRRKIGGILPEATYLDYEEAARLYNSEKMLPSTPVEVLLGQDITPQKLEIWMKSCISALLKYYQPQNISFEQLRGKSREFGDKGDKFEYELRKYTPGLNEYNETRYFQENNNLFYKINLAVKQKLKDKLLSRKSLHLKRIILYYGFEFNQEQIAEKLSVHQTTILCSLRDSRKILTEALLSTDIHGLIKPSKWVSNYVQNWLDPQCKKPIQLEFISLVLDKTARELDNNLVIFQEDEKKGIIFQILQLKYGEKLDHSTIARQLNVTEEKLLESINEIEARLEKAAFEQINKIISKYLYLFLTNKCQEIINTACLNLSIQERNWNNINLVNLLLEECISIMTRDK